MAAIFLGLLLVASAAHSFESDRDDDSTSPPPSDPDIQCWNGVDDDSDGNVPPEGGDAGPHDIDPGCVNPYFNDSNEGMIFDSHFTATMEDLSANNGLFSEGGQSFDVDSTESLFFQNSILVGSEQDTVQAETDSSTSSSSKDFYYVDAQRTESESDEAYGFGFLNQREVSESDFSTYTGPDGSTQDVFLSESENRFIDTPHDESSVCGNGMEDLSDDENRISNNPLGDEKGYTGDTFIDCRGDYGRILLKYDMDGNEDSAEHNYGNEDLECNDDDGDAQTTDEDSGNCGSCGGSSSSGGASCGGSKEDYGGQEKTDYYENPNDLIEEYTCSEDYDCPDGSGSSSSTSSCVSDDSYTYISSCESNDCGSCGNKTSYSVSSYGTQYCGQGDKRSFTDSPVDTTNCDNSYSVVDGGGRIGDGRLGNDPAATYTKFTSYADDSWTDDDNDGTHSDDTKASWVDGSGKVWGGYDFAATINADGPKGDGDGFIVIDEKAGSGPNDVDRVVGRESPDGSASVGRNVHYGVRHAGGSDGSATEVLDYDMIDRVDLSCSGRSQVCVKYVDFWVDGPGGDGTPGSPTWTISPSNSDNPSKSEVVSATSLDTEEYTLGQSYSVCKAANRIAEENPESVATSLDWNNGEKLVNCDYMRDEDGDGVGEDVSPLPQACGDESDEHLMVMEGPSVDTGTAENWLGYEQACVDMQETDPNGRPLDSDACVNKGEAYAEGTVMEVESTLLDEEFEEGGESPDHHVCLDLREQDGQYTSSEMAPKPYNYRYNAKPNSYYAGQGYYGGQWYDLDDERLNQFLQDVEGGSESIAESIGSSDAGSSGQETNYVDYYYTRNPNPYHEDYNPYGQGSPDGNRGTSLLADCGPLLGACGDDGGNVRGEVAAPGFEDDFSGTDYEGEGTYQAFSDPSTETFEEWSRDDDFHPQGESGSTSIDPVFTGKLNKIKSASDQLDPSHSDYDILNLGGSDWYYSTRVGEDEAVQYAYTKREDWVVDSTGVPYPPGGGSSEADYTTSDESSAGTYHHINQPSTVVRGSVVEDTILKTRKAHGNSIAVVAGQDISASSDPELESDVQEGEGFWINPDDIKTQWENGNIDRSYW